MEKSLFIPLREEGLTTMRIRYDFKTGAVRLYAAKEWEPDHDFAGYNHTWWIDGIYTEDARFLNTKEVWALFEKYGQKEYLEEVLDLLRAGKHFGIDIYYYDKYDIRYMMNEHSRKLGLLNKPATVCGANLDARLSRAQLPFSLSKAQKISLHRSVCSKRSTCMAGRYFYSFLLNLKDQPSTQSTASIMESTKGISLMIRSPRPNERMAVTMNCNGPFPFFSNRPLARYFSSSGI